ncbi:alpha/beta hydrolase [Paraconexibacter sp.]|uniref:alpha/beta hydrolase n=1 Tax=Paraconexibacter sp. TaxID=2949640 RepID=UPI0035681D70
MPTYACDARAWRSYRDHLPPSLRLGSEDLPQECSWSWDGLAVHLDRYERPDSPLTVVVVHGAGGYGRLLAPFGRMLADAGADVVLPDLPGYGLTACPPGRMRYETWVTCLVDLIDAERARTGRPVALFGMSMGGMLALHAAMAAPVGAVAGIAATTLMDPRDRRVRRGAGRLPTPAALLRTGVADRLRLPMPLLAPIERMSSVRPINRRCLVDPQGGGNRVPIGFLRSWLTYAPACEPQEFDRCPVLLAHPVRDRWTPTEWSRDVLDRLAVPTTFVPLQGCEHLPVEEPGLTTLREALRDWLGAVAPGAASLPSGAA